MIKIDRVDVTTHSIHILYRNLHKDESAMPHVLVIQDWQKYEKLLKMFQDVFKAFIENHIQPNLAAGFDWAKFVEDLKIYESITKGGKQ